MNTSILRKKFPYTFNNMTLILIGINVVLFFLSSTNQKVIYYGSMIPVFILRDHFYWQFVTYMFFHANITHLLFNMLGLFFFGSQVEKRIGSWEFLLFYLLTGILAGIFSYAVYIWTGNYVVILMGASGAVYAVLLAFAVFFPFARIFIFGIIPVQAPVLVVIYTIIEVFSQVSGRNSNIAHLTHLAGFGFAYLYILIRMGVNPIEVWKRTRH
ncbi:MAG: rhomboid family intramembrane serine protease [Spirochaetia bacterium]|nr:rhomboid family intramembrane serine protease [Spirochaetia bacterium]